MSKITIDKSKVIIDGHARDLETCNTLTNLCDELSKSDKFRTVRYENGYGEFESVSENEEKKFAPSRTFEIYSNDGSLRLAVVTPMMTEIISVVEDGLISDNTGRIYTYSGDKIFKGLTLTKGSSNIDLPIGRDISFYELNEDICYIVEEELGYQVNINSNNGATTLAQNATVDSVVVTTTGVQLKCGDTVNATYTYSGSKLFAGLSTFANVVAAEYKPGDTISITAATDLYIVENIVLPDSYSTLTALFSDIATVIREKTGDTASIIADDFPDVIRSRLEVKPFKPDGKYYLAFSSPNSFTLKVNDATKHWNSTLEYFASDRTWSTWDGTTTLSSATSGSENVLYLRGTGNTVITGSSQKYGWSLTGSDISCIGNIETLLDYATVEAGNHPTMADYCYEYMFYNCTGLTQAPALPATTLTNYCYYSVFNGCTSLTQAPALPATTLMNGCYAYMFRGCTSLTQAPALPATTLAIDCYVNMFSSCTSLTQAPALPATTLTNYCYFSMFYNCTNLTQAPALPATKLADSCYQRMFNACTSLTQVPALPTTKLASECYSDMFKNCKSLKLSSTRTGTYTVAYRIPRTGTGTTATNALYNMFYDTGGTFKGTPEINTTYYLSNTNTVV